MFLLQSSLNAPFGANDFGFVNEIHHSFSLLCYHRRVINVLKT